MTEPSIEFTEGDWKDLFPVEFVTVASHQVPVRALSLEDITNIMNKQLPTIMGMFSDEIEMATKGKKDSTEIIMGKLKKHMTNISFLVTDSGANLLHGLVPAIKANDFKRMPPPIILNIVAKTLEMNLSSFEELEKNLKPLMENFHKLVAVRGKIKEA